MKVTVVFNKEQAEGLYDFCKFVHKEITDGYCDCFGESNCGLSGTEDSFECRKPHGNRCICKKVSDNEYWVTLEGKRKVVLQFSNNGICKAISGDSGICPSTDDVDSVLESLKVIEYVTDRPELKWYDMALSGV